VHLVGFTVETYQLLYIYTLYLLMMGYKYA